MDKKDLYIKARLQQDKEISNQAKEVFEKFEGGINLEKKDKQKGPKIVKFTIGQAILAFTSLAVLIFLGGNLYAHIKGKPNIYSAIRNLFVKEDKYASSEVEINQTVESNGIKLTLKTVAMDENLLITKYIAEGEKLTNDFYTYPEFEDEMIDIIKIRMYIAGWKEEEEYGKYSNKDITIKRREMHDKLLKVGLSDAEATELFDKASNAYTEYLQSEYAIDGTSYSSEKAQDLISEVIAIFEGKVASQYQILVSNDTLQGFGINSVAQKIEKSGNQYIIYNMYSVDTITDLTTKFKLAININKIGNTEGTWKFETELEKARLDTRVEIIDFYENNSKDMFLGAEVSTGERLYATAEAKRLVLSDFSSVLMIQTSMNMEVREKSKYGDGVPFVYIVKDENGKVVGTGTLTEEQYNNSGSKYANRIILDGVNMNTKKLYVHVYEQWELDGEMEKTSLNNGIIELDIETARNGKHVELNQNAYDKDIGVTFNYPGNWTIDEKQGLDELVISAPEDVDGRRAFIRILHHDIKVINNIEDFVEDGNNMKVSKSEIPIDGRTGEDYLYEYQDIKQRGREIRITTDDSIYIITYGAGNDTQFERYYETADKIIRSIKFVEAEKSYQTFDDRTSSYKTL